MASLGEMIAYAEWKRSQKGPDPGIIAGMNSLAGAIKNIQANKQKNRIYSMISRDPSKYKMEIDEDGKVKYTFDPTKDEKKVYDMGDKLVKYDSSDDSTSVLFDNQSPDKAIERRIKAKQANGEDLSRSEMDYYNRNMTSSSLRMPYTIPDEEDEDVEAVNPSAKTQAQGGVPLYKKLIAAAFPPLGAIDAIKSLAPKAKPTPTPTSADSSGTTFFKNKQTGGLEPFKKVNGQWVRISQ